MHILALEKDLFFSVKIHDTLRHHGMEVAIVRTLSAFEQHLSSPAQAGLPALAIVHIAIAGIDWETAIRMACTHNIPVLAFGSHMDLEARRKAIEAGATRVVANSKFSSDMQGIVRAVCT